MKAQKLPLGEALLVITLAAIFAALHPLCAARSGLPAPKFWPTMVIVAVLKARPMWDDMPNTCVPIT